MDFEWVKVHKYGEKQLSSLGLDCSFPHWSCVNSVTKNFLFASSLNESDLLSPHMDLTFISVQ